MTIGSELWFLLGGPALDAIELRFDEVLTLWPAPNGQLWFPGESSSNVGVAFLQDEATASDPPGPSRLPPLEEIPDACAFTVHTLRSVFGTSSEPSERSSLDLEGLDVTEASPSMASSLLDSDGSSMLQTARNMQGPKRITAGACRSTLLPCGIPTPCRNWKLPPCVLVAGSGLSEPPEDVTSLHNPATLNHAAPSATAEYSGSSPAYPSYGTAASSPAAATISSDKGDLAAAALPTYPISLELAFRNPTLAGQLAQAAVTLNSVITCPAFPLSFCHALHGLHPAASDWIANATWISWAEAALDAAEVFVYTDGSSACGKGAWAFVVFSWHWAKGWCFHGSCAGLNSQCLFGEHSQHAFVAEASAICAALSWALTLQPGAILHLSYDCLSAGKAATGEWRIPHADDVLQALQPEMAALLQGTTKHGLISLLPTSVTGFGIFHTPRGLGLCPRCRTCSVVRPLLMSALLRLPPASSSSLLPGLGLSSTLLRSAWMSAHLMSTHCVPPACSIFCRPR